MHADDGTVVGDDHDVFIVADHLHAHEPARLFVEHARLDALAGAALQAVLLHVGALAEAVGGEGEHLALLADDQHIDEAVLFGEGDGAHALRVSAHRADVFFAEADALALARGDHQLVLPGGELHGDQLVALVDLDGDLAHLADVGKLRKLRLFDQPAAGRHGDKAVLPRHGDDGGDLFALVDLHEVDDRPAARLPLGFGDLVRLDGIHLAEGGEEEDIVVRGADEQVFDEVFVLHLMGGDAHAAAALRLVLGGGLALDVARMGHGDDDVFLFDEVGDVDIAVVEGELGLALGREPAADVGKVRLDDVEHALPVGEDVFQVEDGVLQRFQLLLQLFHFEGGEALQAHLQDGVRLLVGEFKGLHQALAGDVFIRRLLDDGDDFVDIRQRQHQTSHDVRPLFRLGKVETGAADDDFLLMLDIVMDALLEVEHLGLAVDEGEQDDAVGGLQLGMFVQGVEHHLGVGVFAQFDDDAHAVAVGLVADIRNAVYPLVADEVGDRLDELFFIDLIRDLGGDDAGALGVAGGEFLDLAAGAQNVAALARHIGALDARTAHEDGARGEIWRGDVLHQPVDGDVWIVDLGDDAVDDLGEVVRRDIGRHADGDAVAAVDQKVREARRQHGRLHARIVEGGIVVYRLFIEVAQHLRRQLRHPRFRIAHRCGRVAVYRAEVAVAVYQGEVDGEVLRQAHEGVVHGGVAVRVVFT